MGDSGIIRRIDEGTVGCADDGEDEFGWYLPRLGSGPEHARSLPRRVWVSQPPNTPLQLQGVQKADAGLDVVWTGEGV